MDDMLQSAVENIPMISQIYVTDDSGMQIYKTSYIETIGDRSDREYFKKAIKGEAYFSDVIVSRSTGKPISVIAVPIYDHEKIVGILGASIELSYLTTLNSNMGFNTGGFGFIVDRTGKVISHPDDTLVSEMKDLSSHEPVRAVMYGESGSGQYIYEGTHKMVSYTTSAITGWGILVQRPTKEVFYELNKTRLELNLFMILLFGGAIITSFPIARVISKPVKEILNELRHIANHDFDIEFNYKRNDEFGLIQNEIEKMSAELAITHEEQERRVRERTEALNESNEALQNAIYELDLLQDKLVVSERISALNEMGRRMSHEINTAIGNSIIAASYMQDESSRAYTRLHDHSLTQSSLKEYIKTGIDSSTSILKQLEHINKTIRALKNSVVEENTFELIRFQILDEIETAIINSNYHMIEAYVEMDIKCDEHLQVMYYRKFIDQIIIELVNNTVQYAFEDNQNGKIHIEVSKPAEYLYILYEDNGKGISEELVKSIFEPFQKSSMSNAGIGIGLSHLYNMIVNFASGEITCNSSLGEGIEFEIYLPLEPRVLSQNTPEEM